MTLKMLQSGTPRAPAAIMLSTYAPGDGPGRDRESDAESRAEQQTPASVPKRCDQGDRGHAARHGPYNSSPDKSIHRGLPLNI